MLRFYRETMGFRLQRELGGAWFELEVGDKMKVRLARNAIAEVRSKGEPVKEDA